MKSIILCLLVASAFAAPSLKPRFYRGRNKIIGGTDAKPGEVPYQVSLQENSYGDYFHICGGSIYDETTIICAAHCVTEKDGQVFEHPENLRIVAGANNLNVEESTQQAIVLSKIIENKDYGGTSSFRNDISLLKLSSSLKFDEYVDAIALPKPKQHSAGNAIVSGWGVLTEGGDNPDVLQLVTVPIVSDDDCRTAYGNSNIEDSMICAGKGGKDSCQGDAGGPMVCKSGGSTYLCGIVSWGWGCATPEYPGVYTEVSYFVDWIHANA